MQARKLLLIDLDRTLADYGDVTSLAQRRGARIATGPHCFGCTAGAGSSCGGALR